jgi:TRAP-type C4-dicarboxylate transport system substrate-binding protein
VAICLHFLTPAAALAKPVVVKLATLAPEGSSWMRIFKEATDEVQQKTGGAVQFRIYPGGVMGDEQDMIRKMHIGQIHAAVLTSAGLSMIFPDLDAFQIPFLFDSYAEVDHALARMGAYFQKGMEDNGYTMLGWSEAGFVYLMSTVPIETIDKLKKAKVWIWMDSPMSKAIFEEAGVIGVPLSIPDVLVGLQTGLVEVVYAPPTGAIALQWFTRIKHLTDVPLLYLMGGLALKKEVFDKIPGEHHATVREVFGRHFARLKEVIRRENQEAIEVMRKHGVQTLTPAPDQVAEYKEISARAMTRPGAHKFSPQAKEQVGAALRAFRAGAK